MTTVQEQSVVIGLGEYHVTKDPDTTLVCYGIGSCIAFAAHDPVSGVVGMAHFVLPDSTATTREVNPARFCDTGVPLMLRELERAGADLKKTSFRIAGGAHMTIARGFEAKLNIGERNIEATKAKAVEVGIRFRGEDVGGAHGRTVRLSVATGKVTISNVGGATYEL